jgi:hypothetical protein
MHRSLVAASAAALAITVLAGCTAPAPQPSAPAPTAAPGTSAPHLPNSSLPECDVVAEAVGELLDGLEYSAETSAAQTAPEAYEQRVCVFLTPDGQAQLGVTIAAISFLQTELDLYSTMPNAIADERTAERGSVLQTFVAGDGDDGHLDRSLFLYDLEISVTVEGHSASGSTVDSLPQLTLPAAVDAAFAVRALLD